jgi:hypothetical protein
VPRVAALVLKIYLLSLLRRPRGGAILARAVVRLFCTQKPTRRVHDMWACTAGRTAPTPRGGGGSYKTSCAMEGAAAFLDGLVLTPVGGRRRGPLRTCRGGRRRWQVVGAEVAAVVGAMVVASTREPLGASYQRDPAGPE